MEKGNPKKVGVKKSTVKKVGEKNWRRKSGGKKKVGEKRKSKKSGGKKKWE